MSEFESNLESIRNELRALPASAFTEPFTSDLDWMAFCYIADELSGEQLTQFESRLEDDPEARDAVSRMMELSTSVFESGFTPTSQRADVQNQQSNSLSTPVNSKLNWVIGLAAALLLGVGLAAWITNWEQGSTDIAAQSHDEELAIAWADAVQDVEFFETNESTDSQFSNSEIVEEIDEEDWMFVAIAELEGETAEDDTEVTQ